MILIVNGDIISETDDLRRVAEHNQKSLLELVKNFPEVCIYLTDGKTILISKENNFEFKDSKFYVYDKNIEVDILDILMIEFSD